MADIRDHGLALRRQRRHTQRSAAPEVRAPHRRAVEPLRSQHHRHPAVGADVRAHPGQLIHMAVAAAEQVFFKHRRAPAPQQRRHNDSLHVRGKAGIGGRADRRRSGQTSFAAAAEAAFISIHRAARRPENCRDRGEMIFPGIPQINLSTGGGTGAQVGRRRNAVGHHGVCTAVEGPPAPNSDGRGPGAGNVRPAGGQEILKVLNFRLPGRIGQNRDTLRAAGCQHQVFRSAHRWKAQHKLPPCQCFRLTAQRTALVNDFRAQRPQAGEVQVNGPGSQLTAARAAEGRLPAPGQNGP